MTLRTRKFFGIILTAVWMTGYALVTMVIGGIYVVGNGKWFELPFYVLAGVAWIPVEMSIIRWMSKPDPGPDPGPDPI
jgi:uncharacterized membrane protein